MNQSPILLFGMPRSGTTWLGKIFDSHPDTLYRHEPDSGNTLRALPLFAFKRDAEQYRAVLAEYMQRLPNVRHEKVAASLPVFSKSYYSPFQIAARQLLIFGAKAGSRLLGSLLVPNLVDTSANPRIRLVWKSIESLGRLGMLSTAFPKARAVLILRHPCGYVASVLRGESKRKFQSSSPISEDWGLFELLLDLPYAKQQKLDMAVAKAMEPAERLALMWALSYEHALTETSGCENVIAVRYEDVCERPLEEVKRLFEHCRLESMPSVEEFIASSTASERKEYYSVFKDPKIAAWKWRQELPEVEVKRIMDVVNRFQAGRFYGPARREP